MKYKILATTEIAADSYDQALAAIRALRIPTFGDFIEFNPIRVGAIFVGLEELQKLISATLSECKTVLRLTDAELDVEFECQALTVSWHTNEDCFCIRQGGFFRSSDVRSTLFRVYELLAPELCKGTSVSGSEFSRGNCVLCSEEITDRPILGQPFNYDASNGKVTCYKCLGFPSFEASSDSPELFFTKEQELETLRRMILERSPGVRTSLNLVEPAKLKIELFYQLNVMIRWDSSVGTFELTVRNGSDGERYISRYVDAIDVVNRVLEMVNEK